MAKLTKRRLVGFNLIFLVVSVLLGAGYNLVAVLKNGQEVTASRRFPTKSQSDERSWHKWRDMLWSDSEAITRKNLSHFLYCGKQIQPVHWLNIPIPRTKKK